MWSVYIHTFPNGKKYVGICKCTPKKRWGAGGKRYNEHPVMSAAIRKYGWDNVTHEIVANGLTQQEAMKMEEALIAKYKTFPPTLGFGYNCTSGGESRIPSDETREKIGSASKKYWDTPGYRELQIASRTGKKRDYSPERRKQIGEKLAAFNRGKHLSEEHRRKISEAGKGRNAWNTGLKMPDDVRKKLSEIQKTKCHKHSEYHDKMILEACRKPVLCVETGIVYYSQREAAKETGANEGKISEVVKVSRKTAGGYHWQRVEKTTAP